MGIKVLKPSFEEPIGKRDNETLWNCFSGEIEIGSNNLFATASDEDEGGVFKIVTNRRCIENERVIKKLKLLYL